jgi:AcrR family transcriptional regulator
MTRITKDPDERRSELIACAKKFFYTQGYESTSVRDIVDAVGVAKGTFYYYFDSKQDILGALVAELSAQRRALLEAIVAEDALNAMQKWARWMQVYGDWKIERKNELLALSRVMQVDENVLLYHKLRAQTAQITVPILASIIEQGIEEGVFETAYVEEAAEIVYAVSRTFTDSMTDILLNPDNYGHPEALARRKVTAAQTAIERVLGAAPGSLPLADENTLMAWFAD